MSQLLVAGAPAWRDGAARNLARYVLGPILLLLLLGWAPLAAAANLGITSLTELADPVPAGGVIDYRLIIHNGGPEAVADSVVAFDLPTGTSAINLPAYCSVDAVVSTRVVCVIPQALDNGDSFQIDLQVATAGLGPGTVDITAAVGRQPAPPAGTPLGSLPPNDPFFAGDSNVGDNLATQNTTLIQAGDLALSKSAAPDPVVAGGEVTYTIIVTNNGPSVSTNFNVADTLPSGVTYVAGSAQAVTGSWTFAAQNGTYPGSLAVGQSASYTFRGKVNVASGSVVNTATVNAVGTPDPIPGNNSGSAAVNVAAGADLAIDKTAAPAPALPGELITFTVTVTNNGPSPAETVSWTDPMPSGFLIESTVDAQGWTCITNGANTAHSCALPVTQTLAVGASATFSITARVPLTGPGSNGTVSNTATVTGSLPDSNTANNDSTANFTVLPNGADLSLSKSKAPQLVPIWPGAGAPPAGSGYIITSTINVKNEGPAPAISDVQVVDQLALGEEYFPSVTTPWTCTATPYSASTPQIVTCNFDGPYPLAAGQATPPLKLLSFAHTEAAGSTLTNTACAGGSGGSTEPGTGSGLGDPNGSNDCNGAGVRPALERADLSVAKRTNGVGAADNTLPIGYTGMSYTITVNNAGPDATTGVVVEDSLPGFLRGRTSATVQAPANWTCTVSGAGTLHCESGTTPLPANTPTDIVVTLTGPLADSASRPAATCGAVAAPAGAWCNTAGVGIDPSVAGAAGEVNPGNNTGSDYVRVPRVANVKTEAKTITSGNPGGVGIDTTYRIEYRNEGPSLAPAVVFRDVINLRADDPGFTLVTDNRNGGGSQECLPTVTGGVTLTPGTGGVQNVSSNGAEAGTLVITCTPLDMPGGQQNALTVVIRPLDDPIAGGPLRLYTNTASFYFDANNDGTPDPSGGTDANGDYEYNNIATPADDEKSASLSVSDGDVDLVVNKEDTGFTGGVDPLPYDPNDPAGNFISYRLSVQNLGPSVASSVTITDTITPEPGKTVRFVGASPSPTGPFTPIRCPPTAGSNPTTGSPLTLECEAPGAGFPGSDTEGVIAPGATSVLYLRYQYQSQPGAGGDAIRNVAVATAAEPESNPANNTEDETTAIRSKVDLAIVKQAVSRTTPPDPDPSVALPPVLSTVSIREPFFWVSERRAQTVRQYLIGKGIAADIIKYEWRGDSEQVQACDGMSGAKLRECLLPNRRVEVKFTTER